MLLKREQILTVSIDLAISTKVTISVLYSVPKLTKAPASVELSFYQREKDK